MLVSEFGLRLRELVGAEGRARLQGISERAGTAMSELFDAVLAEIKPHAEDDAAMLEVYTTFAAYRAVLQAGFKEMFAYLEKAESGTLADDSILSAQCLEDGGR